MTVGDLLVQSIGPTLICGAIGWVFKNALGRQEDRQKRIESDQVKAAADIEKLKEEKVNREDWLRESTRNGQKMDHVIESLAELKGQVQIGAQVAGALRQVAEKVNHAGK